MSRSRLVVIGAVLSIVAAFGVAPAAQAAEDYFLTFQTSGAPGPAIVGESTDATFSRLRAVEVNSFDWSAENAVSLGSATGGAGAGKAKLNRLSVQKPVDSASTALFQRMATGLHFPSMVLYVRKAGGGAGPTGGGSTGGAYLQYQFGTVFVSSVSPSGDGEQMRERVTFEYGSLKQTYWPLGADGTVFRAPLDAGWNQVTNMPL
jgi:type VI secretion system secreted protein Hcp